MVRLETTRLILEELNATDGAFMHELLNTDSWKKYIGNRNIHTAEEGSNYITNRIAPSYQTNGFGFYKVRLKENNLPIGICGLVKRDGLEDIDIGFAYLPKYEGKGYGSESSVAIMKFAKNKLNVKTLLAITVSYNLKSITLLEKLGLKFEKTIRLPNDPEELMLFVIQL
ncbi:GNAT family N-acetyltransferase [soil metagenome]